MPRRRQDPSKGRSRRAVSDHATELVGLRIIGGRFRGRRLRYGGDLRVRPMKDRVREAVFNLVGDAVRGRHAVDLFAGTGALGLEALSRGATRATFVEQHHPTARILGENIAALGVQSACEVIPGNVFLRSRWVGVLGATPWLVFSSPPYAFYVDRWEEMLDLIGGLMKTSPGGSLFVVEADQRLDFGLLPESAEWDVRRYPPATIGVYGN